MSKGIELIAAERQRQIEKEGYSPEHDEIWEDGELAIAGACYAVANTSFFVADELFRDRFWPWDEKDYKPSEVRLVNLVKAGALIAAEIDRLQRIYEAQPPRAVDAATCLRCGEYPAVIGDLCPECASLEAPRH